MLVCGRFLVLVLLFPVYGGNKGTRIFIGVLFCKIMTKKQRESTAKYLYDVSKGTVLLGVNNE